MNLVAKSILGTNDFNIVDEDSGEVVYRAHSIREAYQVIRDMMNPSKPTGAVTPINEGNAEY